MPNPAINRATTFSSIPGFVPRDVLWYAADTDLMYIGTGISNGGGTPGVVQIGATSIPVISQRLQALNITTATSVSLNVSTTQMVQVSLYMSATGNASAGHAVDSVLNYTCELGAETITVAMPLDSRNITMETYPLLVIGGTTVTLQTIYTGGATNDPYNIDARLVQMP